MKRKPTSKANANATLRTMTQDELRSYQTSRNRPIPCGMPVGEWPTRYICTCFNHEARNAIRENAMRMEAPATPLKDIPLGATGDGYAGGRSISWLLAEFCCQLEFESKNTWSGSRFTQDLLCSFMDFMERSVIPYLEKRHPNNKTILKSIENIAYGIDNQSLTLSVDPSEFKKLIEKLLREDSGNPNKREESTRRKRSKHKGKVIDEATAKKNASLNELIDEIRRRARSKNIGIAESYYEIERESESAASKWQKVVGLKPAKTIIDRAFHNIHYKSKITA